MIRRELHQGWTVTAAGGPVPAHVVGREYPAVVPGVVHTDLLAAGAIPDPYIGTNEHTLAWIGRSRWRYELRFDWTSDSAARHDLACDGLDTSASVTLNGVLLGRVANQHRRHRFNLRDALTAGSNHLAIEFDSSLEVVEAMAQRLGRRPQVYPHPYAMLRKSACNFGWDWGPELVTAGIWRAIAIEIWNATPTSRSRYAASSPALWPRQPVATGSPWTWPSPIPICGGPGDSAPRPATSWSSAHPTTTAQCESASARWRSMRHRTPTVCRSSSASTACRSSCGVRTGSRTTRSRRGWTVRGTRGGSPTPPMPTSISCGSGEAASTSPTTSTSCATNTG